LVIILAIAARIHGYGDLRLSVANNDTASYAQGADLNPFSWQGFTSRRLFTTNLLYRLFHPKDGYHILANGSILTTQRAIQPSFTGLAIFQSSLSMLSWSLLAVVLSMRTRNRLLGMIMALLVTAFAFTPQLADWDSILSSESLSLSLFALQFALRIAFPFPVCAAVCAPNHDPFSYRCPEHTRSQHLSSCSFLGNRCFLLDLFEGFQSSHISG
jgi:hypothetical protein